MRDFRLGKVFGVEIRADTSWLVIVFLVGWSLYERFQSIFRDLGRGGLLVMAIVATALFFGSVVVHELSHSVVANRRGIPVKRIRLFIFGGASETDLDDGKPADEFVIAAVGPLSSFVLGGVFLAIEAIAGPDAEIVGGIAGYLGGINMILGVFNLVPGFPLDGGRLLRATLWHFTGDLRKATSWAAMAGQAVGWGLITLGVFMLFGGDFTGLWLAAIGWFLTNAARGSYSQLVMRETLEGVRVRDLMTPNPEVLPMHVSVQHAIDEYVLARRHSAFPVVDGDRVVGLVTLDRLRAVPPEQRAATSVQTVMLHPDGLVIPPDAPAADVVAKLAESPAGRLLVQDGGRLVGIVSASDVAGWLQRKLSVG